MPYFISTEGSFSSAHYLPQHGGKCRNLHGHNWRVKATVQASTLDDQGMVMDFSELKTRVRALCTRLDHLCLNQIAPFDTIVPTAENLAHYFFHELVAGLPDSRVSVSSITIWETDNNVCEYRP